MYKNLAATLVATCFISPISSAFSQSQAPAVPAFKIGISARKSVEAALGRLELPGAGRSGSEPTRAQTPS